MKRLLTLTALLLVAMLCAPAAEIGAQEGESDLGPIATLTHGGGNLGRIHYAEWSSDGTRITTWGHDGTARVWDVEGNLLITFDFDYPLTVIGAGWNEGDTRFVAQGFDMGPPSVPLRLWSSDGQVIVETLGDGGGYWSPSGTRIVTTGNGGQIWDADGNLIASLDHDARIGDVEWNAYETLLLTVSSSWPGGCGETCTEETCAEVCVHEVRVWSSEGELLAILKHDTFVNDAQWIAEGSQIITWSNSECVEGCIHEARVWSSDGRLLSKHEFGGFTTRWDTWLNPDGTKILRARDGLAEVRLTASDEELFTVPNVDGAFWSADGTRIITWAPDGIVQIWSANTGDNLFTLHQDIEGSGRVIGADWNPDETQIRTWTVNDVLTVWSIDSGEKLQTFYPGIEPGSEGYVYFPFWSPDMNRVLVATTFHGYGFWLWDLNTGEEVILAEQGNVYDIEWFPNEIRILTTGYDGSYEDVDVWMLPLGSNG